MSDSNVFCHNIDVFLTVPQMSPPKYLRGHQSQICIEAWKFNYSSPPWNSTQRERRYRFVSVQRKDLAVFWTDANSDLDQRRGPTSGIIRGNAVIYYQQRVPCCTWPMHSGVCPGGCGSPCYHTVWLSGVYSGLRFSRVLLVTWVKCAFVISASPITCWILPRMLWLLPGDISLIFMVMPWHFIRRYVALTTNLTAWCGCQAIRSPGPGYDYGPRSCKEPWGNTPHG